MIRRGGVRPNRSKLDVFPHVCWNSITRYLGHNYICHALLPAYPHLFEKIKNNVPLPALEVDHHLDKIRDVMLASPGQVQKLTLDCRPQNESHLKKLRLLLKSPSLVTLTVSDLTWLVGEHISAGLSELRLEVAFNHADVDIWSMWCPAFPVPNNITSLSIMEGDRHIVDHDRAPSIPSYLSGGRTCFEVFHRLEKVSFEPPPGGNFWESASDLALSRVRKMTLSERVNYPNMIHLCSKQFVNHAARFTNLVTLALEGACDILHKMVELGAVVPSLTVFKACGSSIPLDHQTWSRIPALLPSLYQLEVRYPPNRMNDVAIFREVLPNGFANLRVNKLLCTGISFETCLVMTVELLKNRPSGHVSIVCEGLSAAVSTTAAALLDLLRMTPSCEVSTSPEVVNGFVGVCHFSLDR